MRRIIYSNKTKNTRTTTSRDEDVDGSHSGDNSEDAGYGKMKVRIKGGTKG